MRCHEARQRIADLEKTGFEPERDKELLVHLDSCSKCADLARAAMLLERDFETSGAGDTEGGLSFLNLRARVEERIDKGDIITNKESSIMHKLANSVKKRPRLGLSLGVAVVLLAFLTLIPFKLERTIGYEVAIAGVDKNLALDTEKVQMLFVELGLDEAKFDVSGCDVTCNLKITDLKSEDDAQLVVAAFDELGNCTLKEVSEIHGKHSAPLLWQIKSDDGLLQCDEISSSDIYLKEIDGKAKIFVAQKISQLQEISADSFSVWITADAMLQRDKGETGKTTIMTMTLGSGIGCDSIKKSSGDLVIVGGDKLETSIHLEDFLVSVGKNSENPNLTLINGSGGERVFLIVSPDGQEHRVNLDDKDCVEKLKELGVTVKYVEGLSSGDREAYFIGESATSEDEINDDNETATKFSSRTPEGYELHQNYPNPFNPATTIIFSLPKAEYTTLEVFNMSGQKVRTIVDEVMEAGDHSIIWDSKDDNGAKVSSGVYLYKLTAGDFSDSKKMTLVK